MGPDLTYANLITILRMATIPFFLMAMIYGHYTTGFFLFVGAGLGDALDGFLARYFRQKTSLGAFLDPMADKLMLTTAYVTLALPNIGLPHPIPVWLPILTICRDVVIVLIALLLHLHAGIQKFPPSWPGKCTTFFQIAFAVACLIENAFDLPELLVLGLQWTVVFFTTYSGLHYLWRVRHQISAPS